MSPPATGDYCGWETPHGPLSVRLSLVAWLPFSTAGRRIV